VSLHWHHTAWASSLCNGHGVCFGDIYRTWQVGPHAAGLPWGCYAPHGGGSGQVHLGYFPTRAAAMRAAASACDRKKFPSR
jgi:hypothetical protein